LRIKIVAGRSNPPVGKEKAMKNSQVLTEVPRFHEPMKLDTTWYCKICMRVWQESDFIQTASALGLDPLQIEPDKCPTCTYTTGIRMRSEQVQKLINAAVAALEVLKADPQEYISESEYQVDVELAVEDLEVALEPVLGPKD
jgi:hypothetical protein